MSVWVNWGLVLCGIACIFGDLVLEVYSKSKLALLGMALIAGGILGLVIDSIGVGIGLAAGLAVAYMVVNRRRGGGHLSPKHVSGH